MKIGLFFGSFNPIHTGHLVIASQIAEQTDIQQVWFVVSPLNPLKKKESLLKDYDRLHLVQLAIEDDPRFRASNVEFSLPRPSYTVDTLVFLEEKYPQHSFSLIMGGDNLATFHKWKNYEVLLKRYSILVYLRPGFDVEEKWSQYPNIQLCEFPQMDLSATFIRHCAEKGISLKYLVPEPVREYIETNHLFQKKGKGNL
jgi:nicotinate-nucleotide adenylyltransferase